MADDRNRRLVTRHQPPSVAEHGSATVITTLARTIRASFDPQPIAVPEVDPELPYLPAPERISEVCRYTLAKLEYALSSGGGLRAWFKLNAVIACILAVPVFTILPVVTFAFGTFATISAYLLAMTQNLFFATVFVIATAALITAVFYAVRLYWGGSASVASRSVRKR